MDANLENGNGSVEILPPVNGTLLTHCGASKVSRADLATLEVPEATNTFQPIPHNVLINAVEESLAYRHIHIKREEYAVSKDGMKMFALLEVNADYEGVRFAIGLRNANDKSMRLSMVAGYRVFICDNMALSGDFKPLLAKHTKNFDLIESVSIGIDRVQRGWDPLKQSINRKRETFLSQNEASLFIYRAFMEKNFPVSLIKTVHNEFFNPSYEDFRGMTLWSMENAFTTAFKKLQDTTQFELTAKLGKLLGGFTQVEDLDLALPQ